MVHRTLIRLQFELEILWRGHFQEEVFEMDAETPNENFPVEDTPSRIYLEIDSSEDAISVASVEQRGGENSVEHRHLVRTVT